MCTLGEGEVFHSYYKAFACLEMIILNCWVIGFYISA